MLLMKSDPRKQHLQEYALAKSGLLQQYDLLKGDPEGQWKMKVNVKVAQLCLTLCNPMDIAFQAPLSMEFSSQFYWSG